MMTPIMSERVGRDQNHEHVCYLLSSGAKAELNDLVKELILLFPAEAAVPLLA
jgi:hypothetical protein